MKYRLIQFEWERFKPKAEAKFILSVSALDPEDREPKDSYQPTQMFWYAPEIYNEDEAVKMFIDAQITRWREEAEWLKGLERKLKDAYKEYMK